MIYLGRCAGGLIGQTPLGLRHHGNHCYLLVNDSTFNLFNFYFNFGFIAFHSGRRASGARAPVYLSGKGQGLVCRGPYRFGTRQVLCLVGNASTSGRNNKNFRELKWLAPPKLQNFTLVPPHMVSDT